MAAQKSFHHSVLLRLGHTEYEITELTAAFTRFDQDGNRILDEKEQEQMRQDLSSFDPDDAAVETAEEAKEPAEADITELCRDMFSKMATYLTGELTATSEDYKLLENMNKLTSLKYLEMKDIAINISRNLKDLNQKYAGLQPYLDQINVIEEQVAALEQAAYKLDAYSKKLEAKYKKLEKR